jgi:hypothetical protein
MAEKAKSVSEENGVNETQGTALGELSSSVSGILLLERYQNISISICDLANCESLHFVILQYSQA